jgi:predicted Fe-Mo cluster-binding NifX family protein
LPAQSLAAAQNQFETNFSNPFIMTTPTTSPKQNIIRLAIPVADGRLHGHFGGCPEFALVDADPQQRTVLSTTIVPAPPHQPGLLPRWLREQGVNAVIAGGIGRRALDLFAQHGITVRAGQPGTRLEVLAAAFLGGQLNGSPNACEHHGHHHDHEHGEPHIHPHDSHDDKHP